VKPKTRFEFLRWLHHVLIFFWGTAIGILVIEVVASPLIVWLLYDIPYALPDWERIKRWVIGIVFIGLIAGTISWYYEKHKSGR